MPAARVSDLFSPLWAMTLGDERIRIAVLDGPVDRSHLAFRRARLTDIDESVSAPAVSEGFASEHGTHIASIIFGQHESRVRGIAPHCSGLLIPIFHNSPSGAVLTCSQVELARAISAAVDRGANIINISGGEFAPSGRAHPVLASALERCDRESVLVVAAAGNDGCDCLHIPAAHPSVLAVGAATPTGEPRESSNWGSQYKGHGILAPGESLPGAVSAGEVAERSGTSAAAAIVSGTAGLLMSLEVRRGFAPNGGRIRQLLLESSDPCPSMIPSTCRRYLSGVLNVDRALSLITKKELKMSLNEPNAHPQSSSMDADDKGSTEISARSHSRTEPPAPQLAYDSFDAIGGTSCSRPAITNIAPSACSCPESGRSEARFVFAFGKIDIGFSSRPRFESICQHMDEKDKNKSPSPYDVDQFIAYLQKNPWDATSVIWTLTLEGVPVYAISAGGPNSEYVVKFLKECLQEQQSETIDRVAIAGVLGGRVTLMTGEELPVIHPALRGTSSFKITALLDHAVGKVAGDAKAQQRLKAKREALLQFIDRVYFGRRNLGLTPRDRAINYVATNVFLLAQPFADAAKDKMQLHSIDAAPSPVCRVGSDCWDVKLEYFFPDAQTDAARQVYRITVDVSDVVPITVGKLRYWSSAD
jgi:cyanobactin maturation PatA/PatG family protease